MKTADVLAGLLGDERICIADVGAADGLAKRWRPIAPLLRVVAFEPDARSEAGTDQRFGAEAIVVPRAAAASEGESSLYLTRKPRCSSLFAPNRKVVERYPDPGRYDVIGTATVSCTTVDAAMAQAGLVMDFLKIDTQGTELDVLRGAARSLESCLGIEVEVEFQPLYTGAALFREVDGYVSGHGFELFDLRRTFFTRESASQPVQQDKGQLVFGDALYFRDWRLLGGRRRVLTLATLLLTYGFADVVMEIARGSEWLSDADRDQLEKLCAALQPVGTGPADRKDRYLGTGLLLSEACRP
jgi:FkbM family methyltransferase